MNRRSRLVIIADDLTGALDSAVAFAQLGLRTVATLSMNAAVNAPVVAINTDSRDDDRDIARDKVGRVTSNYPDRIIFKKIDSTLRGNVVSELLEVLRVSGAKRALIAPAFPDTYRTTRNGVQLVEDRPVHELYQVNRGYPARATSHIPTLLARETGLGVSARSVADVRASTHRLAQSIRNDPNPWLVFDAVTQRDLVHIIKASLLIEDKFALCGSGGLAKALATVWHRELGLWADRAPLAIRSKQLLIVVGTLNPVTTRQLAYLSTDYPEIPSIQVGIDDLLHGIVEEAINAATQGFAQGKNVLISIQNEAFRPGVGRALVQSLAVVTRRIFQQYHFGGLLLTGGDTAQAVCKALDVEAIKLVDEFLPGLPLSHIEGGIADGLAIITKAGGFGQANTLSKSLTLWSAYSAENHPS